MRLKDQIEHIAPVVAGILMMATLSSCGSGRSSGGENSFREKTDSVLALMTLEEKLGQLTLYTSYWDVTGPVMRDDYVEEIRAGRCGNIFNAHTVTYNRSLQEIAVEESRLGIPLLFGYDVIHGHKTIFPTPLAEACSWDTALIKRSARYGAMEAAASGLNWTFAPMVDISRDPRWGRITEGNGEDPYLASRIAEARVMGTQGEDLADPLTLAACVKHFAGYGAPVAGRDYNTVDMSELHFRQVYLPPYKAALDAGAVTVMAAFNDIFGVPSHANKFLLTNLLKEELGFGGFVVADYSGVEQVIPHGVAENRRSAAEITFNAGLDMDMQSGIFVEQLGAAVKEGAVKMEDIDEAVRRILQVKFRLGLFDDPYRYLDTTRENSIIYSAEIMEHALESARKSIVLLKNEPLRGRKILPLKNPGRIAVIGPLADNQLDLLGSWHAAGDHNKVVTLLRGMKTHFPGSEINYAKGCDFYSTDRSGFDEAVRLTQNSDVAILAIGENQAQSGEAASRSDLGLTGVQEELAQLLISTGKPVVILLMAERMLTFEELDNNAQAVLNAWHLGTRAGDAIAQVLAGDYNPSGKLAMTIPRNVGQVPIFYNYKNTGRPLDPQNMYTTKYLDVENAPLYPFGHGIGYSAFEYSNPTLSDTSISMKDTLRVNTRVTNEGPADGNEVVQLYIRDLTASVTRPVKELKGFRRVFIPAGKTVKVEFMLTVEDLKFYNQELEYIAEPGAFKIFVGTSSEKTRESEFKLIQGT